MEILLCICNSLSLSRVFSYSTWSYLHMAAITIAEMSEVKGQRFWAHSPFHHKAEVCFMSASCPAHVLVMIDELFFGKKHTRNKIEIVLFRNMMSDRSQREDLSISLSG